MPKHRSTSAAFAFVVAAALSQATLAQAPRADPTSPATPSNPTTAPSAGKGLTGAPQPDSPASRSSPATTPPSGRGLATQPGAAKTDTTPPGAAGALSAGMPTMGGVVPNRAELPSSAFTKLDAGNRGYVTLDDVRQLDGFETHFRQADQNKDGRLNASEFNAAWSLYSGTTR
jgi:hypothetical protein